ncbi:hypothetical protein [Acetobacter sp.]|uniref:hypothetical protein n=1 Tax=Acetobacter sp. TaxID=440 RepID=UPI0039EB7864
MSHMTLLARLVRAAMLHRQPQAVRSDRGQISGQLEPCYFWRSGGLLAGTLYLMAKRNSWGLADRVRV